MAYDDLVFLWCASCNSFWRGLARLMKMAGIGSIPSGHPRHERQGVQERMSERQRPRERGHMTRLSILEWYRVLRVHHEWTIFQAIRFALWLAR
jgi:hypothetical protein